MSVRENWMTLCGNHQIWLNDRKMSRTLIQQITNNPCTRYTLPKGPIYRENGRLRYFTYTNDIFIFCGKRAVAVNIFAKRLITEQGEVRCRYIWRHLKVDRLSLIFGMSSYIETSQGVMFVTDIWWRVLILSLFRLSWKALIFDIVQLYWDAPRCLECHLLFLICSSLWNISRRHGRHWYLAMCTYIERPLSG